MCRSKLPFSFRALVACLAFFTGMSVCCQLVSAEGLKYRVSDDFTPSRIDSPLVVQPSGFRINHATNSLNLRNSAIIEAMEKKRLQKNRTPEGWFADVEYKYWKMRRRDLDYAASSSNSALAIGQGTIHELEFDRDSGFQASMGYVTSDGWKIGFRYTNFRTDENASLTRAPGETLFSTRSHPKFNEEAITADVDSLFDMNVFDLEVRGPIVLSERASLNVFGGIRWADVDQEFETLYDGFDFVNGEINNMHSMDAIGLRLGGEGTWTLVKGLYLFGGAETSLLYGSHETSLHETDYENGVQDVLVDVSDKYQQAITSLSTSVGIGLNARDYEFRIGYEFNIWYNLADRLVFLDDTHEAIFSHSNHDIVLDGFFSRLSIKF